MKLVVFIFILMSQPVFAGPICKSINKWSSVYEVPSEVIESIISVESSFRHKVEGDDGKSHGLMQVQYTTAQDIGFKGNINELKSISNNVKYGTKYTRILIDYYWGDLKMALDAYNRGFGNVNKHPWRHNWKNHPYVGKILKYIEKGEFRCQPNQ